VQRHAHLCEEIGVLAASCLRWLQPLQRRGPWAGGPRYARCDWRPSWQAGGEGDGERRA
jgi:hypothetical protein